MNDDNGLERSIRGRLELLEAELLTLRRELKHAERQQTRLPSSDFQALKVAIGDDLFGIPIESVREIVRYVLLTRVTDVPDSVAGAINVRGAVHAVIDARMRFGYAPLKPGQRTSIVLTEVRGRVSGLVVDRVLEVVNVTQDSLSEPSGALASAHCVAGIATVCDQIVQVLDLGLLLNLREWGAVAEALSDRPAHHVAAPAVGDSSDGGVE